MTIAATDPTQHDTPYLDAIAEYAARHPARLAACREKLAGARTTAPLFDTMRTTRAIERAYRIMFENRGRPPESFSVPD